MIDTLAFSTLATPPNKTPQTCSLCHSKLASLAYKLTSEESNFRQLEGYACLTCGANLLHGLAKVGEQRDSGKPETSDPSSN